VVVQFVADTFFKALLAVPVAGGVVLVMLLVGAEPSDLLRLEYQEIIPTLIGALLAQPVALAAFLGALGLIAAGGSVLMVAVKAGTLTVLVAGERAAGAIEHPPLHLSALTRAACFSIERFTAGMRVLFRRYLALVATLAVAYALSLGAYALFVLGPPLADALEGPLVITLASLWVIGLITLVNFLYLLTQLVGGGQLLGRRGPVACRTLLVREARPIVGVLGAILALMALTTAASAWRPRRWAHCVRAFGVGGLCPSGDRWLLRGLVPHISLTGARRICGCMKTQGEGTVRRELSVFRHG
jgi:hypothetical protein